MTTDKSEPTLEDVIRESPGWHCWEGLAGLVYARLVNSSPPIVVRAEDAQGLMRRIVSVESERDESGRLPPGLVLHLGRSLA